MANLTNPDKVITVARLARYYDDSLVDVVQCTSSTVPATLAKDTYYNVTGTVSSLSLVLPTIADSTHLHAISVCFTTGSSTPSVSISSAGSATISYFSGYSIKASTSYELNIMWNGTKWIVAYAVIE